MITLVGLLPIKYLPHSKEDMAKKREVRHHRMPVPTTNPPSSALDTANCSHTHTPLPYNPPASSRPPCTPASPVLQVLDFWGGVGFLAFLLSAWTFTITVSLLVLNGVHI